MKSGAGLPAGVIDVEVVSLVDAAPHDANRTATATTATIRLIIPTVYGSSEFARTGAAHADEREVRALYFGEPMGCGKLTEHCGHPLEGDVNGPAALLAHEVLVVPPAGEVDDRRPVAEVDMVKDIETLEHVECAVHGRLVDGNTRRGFGPFPQFGCIEVLSDVGGERFADRASCRGDSKTFGAKVGDERVDVDHGARNDGMPVIAFPRISV